MRDVYQAIEDKRGAYQLLTSCTLLELPQRMDQIYDVLYGEDGLCLLLKMTNQYVDVRKLTKEFLRYIDYLPKQTARTYALYRADAYLTLANLSYEGADGERRISEAKNHVNRALDALKLYEGTDEDLACYLEAVANRVLADCQLVEGDQYGAIEALEHEKAKIEELVARNANTKYQRLSVKTSIDLGMLYRKRVMQQVKRNKAQGSELMEPAIKELTNAVGKSRRLVETDPSIENRMVLVEALQDCGMVTLAKKPAVAQLKEALLLAKQIQEETSCSSYDEVVEDINTILRKRQGFFGRLFGR